MNATVNSDIFLWHDAHMDIKQDFAQRFQRSAKEFWNSDKPNQKEMAKFFEVSQATISDWWNGAKVPGLEKLVEICLKMDLSLEWLGTGRGAMKPTKEIPQVLSTEQKLILKEIIDLIIK